MRANGKKKNRGERQKVTSTPVKNTGENTYDELSFADSENDSDNNWLHDFLSNRGTGPLDKFLQNTTKKIGEFVTTKVQNETRDGFLERKQKFEQELEELYATTKILVVQENADKAINKSVATNNTVHEISLDPPTVLEAKERSWNDDIDPEIIGVTTRAKSKSQQI